jgi:hypothetical protein
MEKYFVIKNIFFNAYYSFDDKWVDDVHLARTFETKEEARTYGQNNSLGFCVIIEFYNF